MSMPMRLQGFGLAAVKVAAMVRRRQLLLVRRPPLVVALVRVVSLVARQVAHLAAGQAFRRVRVVVLGTVG